MFLEVCFTFSKSAEERNVCLRKLNGPEVIEIRGSCVRNGEGDNFLRGIWSSPSAMHIFQCTMCFDEYCN